MTYDRMGWQCWAVTAMATDPVKGIGYGGCTFYVAAKTVAEAVQNVERTYLGQGISEVRIESVVRDDHRILLPVPYQPQDGEPLFREKST